MDWVNSLIARVEAGRNSLTLIRAPLGSALYRQGQDDLLGLYYQKRRVPPELKIYYPVSETDLFPPVPVVYRTGERTSLDELLQTIWTFYETPLTPQNIEAYGQTQPELGNYLRSLSPPRLRDAMVTRLIITGLRPYQDGYLLEVL